MIVSLIIGTQNDLLEFLSSPPPPPPPPAASPFSFFFFFFRFSVLYLILFDPISKPGVWFSLMIFSLFSGLVISLSL